MERNTVCRHPVSGGVGLLGGGFFGTILRMILVDANHGDLGAGGEFADEPVLVAGRVSIAPEPIEIHDDRKAEGGVFGFWADDSNGCPPFCTAWDIVELRLRAVGKRLVRQSLRMFGDTGSFE